MCTGVVDFLDGLADGKYEGRIHERNDDVLVVLLFFGILDGPNGHWVSGQFRDSHFTNAETVTKDAQGGGGAAPTCCVQLRGFLVREVGNFLDIWGDYCVRVIIVSG